MTDYEEWATGRGIDQLAPKHPQPRITMDDYGLELAAVVAKRAACTRRQVGAVIIGADKRIMATGYNGAPAGEVHCTDGGCPRGRFTKEQLGGFEVGNNDYTTGDNRCVAAHAEQNAVQWCLDNDLDMAGATIYISCGPCAHCEELCQRNGLRVVWPW